MRLIGLTATVLLLACEAAPAQSPLADRILAVKDGTVRLAFPVREGICGNGENFIRDRSRGEDNYMSFEGNINSRNWRYQACEPGPARVVVMKTEGAISRVRVYVGGDWKAAGPDVTDLGMVSGPAAAKALLAVAVREHRGEQAVFAATIADSVVIWPELLSLAKNESVNRETRKTAIFWLSQAAGDAATKGLADMAEDESEDREMRDQAVFALSQLSSDRGVPILIRLAKSNKDPKVRRKALFWLGQSDDPRVLALFEEILTKP
jgi:hypothetical protein